MMGTRRPLWAPSMFSMQFNPPLPGHAVASAACERVPLCHPHVHELTRLQGLMEERASIGVALRGKQEPDQIPNVMWTRMKLKESTAGLMLLVKVGGGGVQWGLRLLQLSPALATCSQLNPNKRQSPSSNQPTTEALACCLAPCDAGAFVVAAVTPPPQTPPPSPFFLYPGFAS